MVVFFNTEIQFHFGEFILEDSPNPVYLS